jgi:hypothetical protein
VEAEFEKKSSKKEENPATEYDIRMPMYQYRKKLN